MELHGGNSARFGRRDPPRRRNAAPAAADRRPTRRRYSTSTARSPARACTGAFTASRISGRNSSSRCSIPTGASAARCWARSPTRTASASSRSANYVRLRDPAVAESAFAVADAEQGRGIGTRLLERLAARAAAVGIERFVAEVLPENESMLGVFERAGFELTRELSNGVVEVQFPIASTEQFELSVEERDHTAVVASLRPFFEPASVAVVGASPRRGTIGGELFRNVLEGDFAGAAYPVNPKGAAGRGRAGLRSVAEIPDPVDLAVIAVPGEHVLGGGRGGAPPRRARARRDLGRLRRGRQRGCRAAGAAARARPRARRATDRAELPRHRGRRAAPERDLRRPLGAERQHRVLVAVGRARARAARGGRRARARTLGVRLDREQGRCLLERPARVVGGRRVHRGRAAVRRVVRESRAASAASPGASHAASRSSRSRAAPRRAASAPPARTRRRSRAPRRGSMRSSTRRGSLAPRRSRS